MPLQAISVHAHFYQPPREDPLTGSIPIEAGASPYNNWNERIHAECYRPNAELRNFEQISFNIGPTLSQWMQSHDPQAAQMIADQDQINTRRYGVGNAMAQAYNHTILPLNTTQDKITQVYWGIADFSHRFGRLPEGMWLPETAVDLDTLEILARFGIRFTILAPWQANAENIDTTEPHIIALPNQQQVTVFFYQQDLSGRVSFDPSSTINADHFVQQLLQPYFSAEKARRGEPQILLLASDGELYGHHQARRDLFLARLVDGACNSLGIRPTYPAYWLRSNPPRQTVEIRERTSWSCHHGVARWLGQCPCTPGDGGWKAQLRYAFERLVGELDRLYLEIARPLVHDPWLLRNRYIHVLLGELSFERLLSEVALHPLTTSQSRRIHLMLEAQRERQRMFTSCGWFFDDFDRIEPRNNVAYAAQAVRLAYLATGIALEDSVSVDLERVISARSGLTAEAIFRRHLRKAEALPQTMVGYAD